MVQLTSWNNKSIEFIKRNWKEIIFFLLVLISSFFLFNRCRYGFISCDEACYFGTPYRILQGDSFFWDEWHVNQMSSFPLLPIVRIAILLNGSMDGIYLKLRYLYTFVQLFVSIFIYIKLKKFNWLGAVFASLSFMVYTPFNIMALCYNTICPICLIISLLLLLTNKGNKIILVLSGILFAISVLCCPMLIFGYFINIVLFFVTKKYRSKHLLQMFLFFFIGCFIMAALFFVFVFSKITVTQFLTTLPYILSDPNHDVGSLSLLSYFKYIWKSCSISILGISIPVSNIYMTLYFLFLLLILLDKKRKKNHKFIYFVYLGIITLVYLFSLFIAQKDPVTTILPLNILAFFIIFLSDDINIQRTFRYIWFPGMAYSFLLNLSSDQCFDAISSASIVALTGSIIMMCIFVNQLHSGVKKRLFLSRGLCLVLLLSQLFIEVYLHYTYVFYDSSLSFFSSNYCFEVQSGSAKGIYTSEYRNNMYNNISKDLETIENDESIQSIAYFFGSPWFYIETPSKRMGSFTSHSWYGDEYTLSQEIRYHYFNPQKIPDAAYFYYPDLTGDSFTNETFELYYSILYPDYYLTKLKSGILLKK